MSVITGEGQTVNPIDGNQAAQQQQQQQQGAGAQGEGTTLMNGGTGGAPGTQAGAQGSSQGASGDPFAFVSDKGEFSDGWLDHLPADLAESKQILGQFKDINGVLKTLVNQQKMLGKKADAVIIPDEKATPEERSAFFKKLGVPDSPDAYTIRPKDLPAGMEWNEEAAKEINKAAHEAGITPAQAEKIMAKYLSFEAQRSELAATQAKAELEAGRKKLAEAWGDKFDIEMSVTRRAAQVAGVDVNSPGFRDPAVVLAINRLARMMSDDKIVNSDTAGTMMAGKARAMDIMTNPQNPNYERYKRGDKEITGLVNDLLQNG
jgi:hypothetical protein